MATIEHWINGRHTGGASTRRGPVYQPATGQRQHEVLLASAADVDTAVRAAAEAFSEWGQASLSQRTRVLFAFRELVNAEAGRIAGIISDEHGKVLSDAAGEVQRGLEVIEFACGIPQLLKGSFSDQASAGVDVFKLPRATRCRRRDHPVQLPGHGADVDAPHRHRLRQHVHPQAQ
jgi:malonate-semialdehyde dehydrogenase (acetylating)/methylmalonate-semialdehyde dehydrogenase